MAVKNCGVEAAIPRLAEGGGPAGCHGAWGVVACGCLCDGCAYVEEAERGPGYLVILLPKPLLGSLAWAPLFDLFLFYSFSSDGPHH